MLINRSKVLTNNNLTNIYDYTYIMMHTVVTVCLQHLAILNY